MPEFPPKLPRFPPRPPGEGDGYATWKQVLSDEEKRFVLEELHGPGFLRVAPLPRIVSMGDIRLALASISDRDIAEAIEADFRDMEHNANRPWDPDFTETCKKLNNVLEKIGYYLVIGYEVRKYGHF